MEMCWETMEMALNKINVIPRKLRTILFFGSAHGRLNGNFFLISAHGVLRRMGAVLRKFPVVAYSNNTQLRHNLSGQWLIPNNTQSLSGQWLIPNNTQSIRLVAYS